MTINALQELQSLDGKPLKSGEEVLTLGKAISNILLSDETNGKMKLFVLAQKFYNEASIELDTSDLALVKGAVQKSKIYSAIVSGQVEKILEELKANN